MIDLRTYGDAPFTVALVHGGPGACGELAPVARELSSVCGVLEPIQTKTTLDGQIAELKSVVERSGSLPIVLAGHSWGAWLCYLMAARHPELVRKLILIGSGPYTEEYARMIGPRRMSRYTEAEKAEWEALQSKLDDPTAWARLGELASKADLYDPLPHTPAKDDAIDTGGRSYHDLLSVCMQMRTDGSLLEAAKQIRCPVVAIQGAYDPHPFEGVEKPLSSVIPDFRMIVLEKCGHNPWLERHARDEFFRVLAREVLSA